MFLSDLHAEIAESICVHHASGHYGPVEAMARLINQCDMTTEQAAETLAEPVGADLFAKYGTWPKENAE